MENVAEKFIEALKERKLSQAIDHIKEHLSEQRAELEESQRVEVASEYGFSALKEKEEEEDDSDKGEKDSGDDSGKEESDDEDEDE